jgi:signal peptidase I
MEANTENYEAAPQPKRTYKRLWCAFASAAIPGSGDWMLGDKKRGGLFLALFGVLLLCYWPLRLPRFYWPLILLVVTCAAVHFVSSCCTFLLGRSERDAASNWWVLVLIPLAYAFATTEITGQLRASGFRVFSIPSESMAPAINPGDYLVADTWYFRSRKPQVGEVVIFHHHSYDLIKRVIATAGSTIKGANDRVEVDGRVLAEPYALGRDPNRAPDERDTFGPFRVPDGEIFVMGDNRDNSLDSRVRSGEYDFGHVFVTDVFGKPLYRFAGSFHRSPYDGQAIK